MSLSNSRTWRDTEEAQAARLLAAIAGQLAETAQYRYAGAECSGGHDIDDHVAQMEAALHRWHRATDIG